MKRAKIRMASGKVWIVEVEDEVTKEQIANDIFDYDVYFVTEESFIIPMYIESVTLMEGE